MADRAKIENMKMLSPPSIIRSLLKDHEQVWFAQEALNFKTYEASIDLSPLQSLDKREGSV